MGVPLWGEGGGGMSLVEIYPASDCLYKAYPGMVLHPSPLYLEQKHQAHMHLVLPHVAH